jgi:hypothetical protein
MSKIPKEQADLYQDFFNFLSQEHNLTCTIEEMDEIIHEAQTFVKKFDIANVSQQRELLLAYHRYLTEELSLDLHEIWIDEHLKANNCG